MEGKRSYPLFTNEPNRDFSIRRNRDSLNAAILNALDRQKSTGYAVSPIIDGRQARGEDRKVIQTYNPSTLEKLGEVTLASKSDAEIAIESLSNGFESWSRTEYDERARIVRRIADSMREHRDELTALIILEVGKPWREADADVTEAIDFCDYYAQQMEFYGSPLATSSTPGEVNYYHYAPRGVAVVIAPWNFPLAIACGMTVAALVTGNATLLKPAEQSSLIAAEFAKLVLGAGVPANAFALLPGQGEVIGPVLVSSPYVALICFTGSRAVGLEILQRSAAITSGQRGIKRVITELGGKNAIIVDNDADTDEAIKSVLQSSFGFAGQKCSACSRLIVVDPLYDKFLARLAEAASDLIVGDAADPASFMGPVIDKESQNRLLERIASFKEHHTEAFVGKTPELGNFVPISIFRDVSHESPLWREELFGPVLACCRARSFSEALALANDSEYALTGGIFSRNPHHIELATKSFQVGNLYINRSCTGALVGKQPFGGFRFSGIGSKAGGPDYLLQFMEPRTVTENTSRRGFVPELV